MSDERRQHPNPPDVPAGDPAPSDRLDSVRPDAAESDQPAVYGTATPGGGRRGFLRTLSHGVVAGSAAALASCSKKEESSGTTGPSASTYTLSGTVTSQANGGVISGATVQIMDGANAGKTATTGTGGTYSISGLTTGGCTVRASASGYSPVSTGVTIAFNQTQNFSLPLPVETTFTMAGVVTNKNTGRAIGNATVRVMDGPNANKTDDTDGNGYYSIPALVRGGFTARGSATGFVALDKAVGIDGDTRVDFQLTPVAGTPCSCEPVCTCNPLCTCNPVCTCDTYSSCTCQSYGHYWYPN